MYVWVIFDGCISAKLHDQYHSVSQLCHSSAHLSPPKIYGTPQVGGRNMITILWGHVTPESHNYTSRCGNIMRLIFARTARRPIAHALHPIHIGGYFLHCNILYPYLLISYNWNVFDNVVWKLYPLRRLFKMKPPWVSLFFYVLTLCNCLCMYIIISKLMGHLLHWTGVL